MTEKKTFILVYWFQCIKNLQGVFHSCLADSKRSMRSSGVLGDFLGNNENCQKLNHFPFTILRVPRKETEISRNFGFVQGKF